MIALAVPAVQPPPAAVQPSPAAVLFAPPADRTLTLSVDSDHALDGQSQHRFISARALRFTRDGAGWIVDLVLTAAPHRSDASGRMFETGIAALQGHMLRLRLDAGGAVRGIDDLATHWARLCDAIAGLGSTARAGSDRAAAAAATAAALRRLPADRQAAMLGSLLRPALGVDLAALPVGTTAVTLPGAGPGLPALTGMRHVSNPAPGQVRVRIDAHGSAGDVAVVLSRETLVDAATGLLIAATERITTRMGAGPGVREQVTETTSRLR